MLTPNNDHVPPQTEPQDIYPLENDLQISDEPQLEPTDNSQNPDISDTSSNTSPITHYPHRPVRLRRTPTYL